MTKHRVLIALAMTLSGCSPQEGLPFYRTAEMSPEWLTKDQASARSMHRVAPFRMMDQNGAVVTEGAFDGKVTIVNFFFTTCGDVCPLTISHLQQLLGDIGNERRIQVLSYSVTPERDSVSELRHFAEHHNISDSRWHFLTGERDATERLAVVKTDKDRQYYAHKCDALDRRIDTMIYELFGLTKAEVGFVEELAEVEPALA